MSKFLTDAWADAFINALRGTAFSVDELEVALYTVAPTRAGGGVEVVGGSYAAQPFTLEAPASGASENEAQIPFNDMPECVVVAAAIRDKVTGTVGLVNDGISLVCAAGSNKAINAGELDLSFPAVA